MSNTALREWIRRQMAAAESNLTYDSFKARHAGKPYLAIDQQIVAQHAERANLETMTDDQLRVLGARFADCDGYLEEWRP